MNGIHDMGGMDGMGPVTPEENEPVFHEPWEGRVYGLTRALARWGRGDATGGASALRAREPPAGRLPARCRYLRALVHRVRQPAAR